MASPRVADGADVVAYCKALKANVGSLNDQVWASTDLEVILDKYKDLMLDLVRITDRPTKAKLTAATSEVFGSSQEEASMCAAKVVQAWYYCKKKLARISTGKKSSPALQAVCFALDKKSKIAMQGRKLLKRSSSEAPSPKQAKHAAPFEAQ